MVQEALRSLRKPVLLDKFLKRSNWTRIASPTERPRWSGDAPAHRIRRVHSGDAAMVLPPHDLPEK